MLAITGLDVAFVSALAALAAGIAAPLSSWLIARTRDRHDRWAKTYDDLRDAYITLLRQIHARRVSTDAIARMLEENDPAVYEAQRAASEDVTARVERLALVSAFASNSVREALKTFDRAWRDVYDTVMSSKRSTEAERRESAEAVREALKKTNDPLRQLGEAIRADLRSRS